MSLEPNSFYLASFPRSGNTWTLNSLSYCLDAVQGEALTTYEYFTEIVGNPNSGAFFYCREPKQRESQPVIVKTHLDRPGFERQCPPSKAIYLVRDCRDSLLSYYFFSQAFSGPISRRVERIGNDRIYVGEGSAEVKFDPGDFLDFLRKEAPAWREHVCGWMAAQDTLLVRYEELHKNFEGSLERMVAFAGFPPAYPVAEVKRHYVDEFRRMFKGEKTFFRKGIVGDWKAHFNGDHLKCVLAETGDLMAELGYSIGTDLRS